MAATKKAKKPEQPAADDRLHVRELYIRRTLASDADKSHITWHMVWDAEAFMQSQLDEEWKRQDKKQPFYVLSVADKADYYQQVRRSK